MRFTVAVLLSCAALAACGQEAAGDPAPAPPVQFERASSEVVAHGERLSRVLGCSGCHGEDLTGQDWSEPGFGKLWTANLTHSARRYTDQQLEAMIRGGARPDGSELWGMPSHLFTHLTADDMAALLAFIRAQPLRGEARPRPEFEEGARRAIAAGNLQSAVADVREEGTRWPADAGADHALGRYIVRATCAECHGMDLAGGQPHPAAAPRPDLRAIMPAYDRAAFTTLLRTGTAAGDRKLELMGRVARGRYSHLTEAELAAVHAYLRAVADSH